jgi:hypothetical protein
MRQRERLRRSPRPLVFLSVGKWESRKGWRDLLSAFWAEFAACCSEHVRLVVKTSHVADFEGRPLDRPAYEAAAWAWELGHDVSAAMAQLLIWDEQLPQAALSDLYCRADAFVLATHGEGWGLPLLEAMASGLPTIAPAWGGHLDFMSSEQRQWLSAHAAAGDDWLAAHGNWRGHGRGRSEWSEGRPLQLAWLVNIHAELVNASGAQWGYGHGHRWAQVEQTALMRAMRDVARGGGRSGPASLVLAQRGRLHHSSGAEHEPDEHHVAAIARRGSEWVHARYTLAAVAPEVAAAFRAALARRRAASSARTRAKSSDTHVWESHKRIDWDELDRL